MKNTGVLTVIIEALIEHADWFFSEGIIIGLSLLYIVVNFPKVA